MATRHRDDTESLSKESVPVKPRISMSSRRASDAARRVSGKFFGLVRAMHKVPSAVDAESTSRLKRAFRRIYRYKLLISHLESRNRLQISDAAAELHVECQRPDRAQILYECGAVQALARLVLLDATTAFGKLLVLQSLQDLCTLSLNEDCAAAIMGHTALMAQFESILRPRDNRHVAVVRLAAQTVCRLLRPKSVFAPPPSVQSPAYPLLLLCLECQEQYRGARIEALHQLDEFTQDVDFAVAACTPPDDGVHLMKCILSCISKDHVDESYPAGRILRNIACNVHSHENILKAVRHVARTAWPKLAGIAEHSGIKIEEKHINEPGEPGEEGADEMKRAVSTGHTRRSTYTFTGPTGAAGSHGGSAFAASLQAEWSTSVEATLGLEANEPATPSVKAENLAHATIRRAEEIAMGEAALEALWYLGTVYSRKVTRNRQRGNFPEDSYASMLKKISISST
uniref:Uncharacterized protein n=1 Tax=Phaeomonas parva TaxID=124430 RepID=A0A7S1U5Y8_9STRA|mmetsp:Transcript_33233/g.105091  ORF Transcript_33233/g.105091 Transcript_33233/m.105091 type:complete len:458 (+) Transcript_33233:215-1588(+)